MNHIKNYDNYRFVVFEYNAPRVVDWSAGSPYHYLILVQSGHGVIRSEGIEMEVKEGDFYYQPMGLAYTAHWQTSHTQLRTMGFRIFPDSEQQPFAPQILPREFIPESMEIPVQIQPDARALGLFYSLLGKLVPIMRTGSDNTQMLVEAAKKWMSTIYLRNSISHIARKCSVSDSTLYTAFQKVEGKTPNTVRREIVVAEAIRILQETSISVSHLSEHLGFSSDTYLRKVLKDSTGMSPREIRKQKKV